MNTTMNETRPKNGRFVLGLMATAFALILAAKQLPVPTPESPRPNPPPQPEEKLVNPLDGMWIVESHWNRSGFGTVLVENFVLMNKNKFPVKDVEITCRGSANSGTVISRNTQTIYEAIPAEGGYIMVNRVNMGFIDSQVSAESCSVTSVVSLAPR